MPDQLIYWVWLNELRGISIATKRTLLSELGSPGEVFQASPSQVCDLLSTYPPSLSRTYQTSRSLSELWEGRTLEEAESIVTVHEKHRIKVFTSHDTLYQLQFGHSPRAPLILYYRGSLPVSQKPFAGVIGTFPVSPSGKVVTREAVHHLIETEHNIASGLSEGTDALVHETVLSLQAPPYAFLPGGLHTAYPAAHASLMDRIADAGAVISPFPYGKEALPFRFIRRNEIFALWCDALLVIETSLTGGTMSTARYAMAHNKQVFAVPGTPGESKNSGTDQLITEGAHVYTREPLQRAASSLSPGTAVSAAEKVIGSIREHAQSTGELCQTLGIDLEFLMEELAVAESDNCIEYRVDGRWHLVGGA